MLVCITTRNTALFLATFDVKSSQHGLSFSSAMLRSLPDPLSLAVGASYDPGDHVFMSYGPVSNDDLLQYYGFVERENPADAYVLQDMGKWLREVCFVVVHGWL